MKYRALEVLVIFVVVAVGYTVQYTDWFPVVFGAIIAVYGWTFYWCERKYDEAKAEKAYQKWQAEMNDRAKYAEYDW